MMQQTMITPQFKADSLIDQLRQGIGFAPSPRRADAAVLLAITREDQPRVLLTRRASHMRHHAGEVSFPGGRREAGDTSNIVVALREAFEETGLNPFQVELLGELPSQRAKSGLWVKPIVGLIPPDVILVPQPDEIAEARFFDFDELPLIPPKGSIANSMIMQISQPKIRVD